MTRRLPFLSARLAAIAAGLCVGTVGAVEPGTSPLPPPPAPAPSKIGEVSEVRIEGAKHVHPDRIRFILSTRAGKTLDGQALADDVRAIERMGPFSRTKSDVIRNPDGTVTVVFQVVEQPYVSAVQFGELNYFERSGIEKVIETKAGGYLNPLILENDRRLLEAHFQDKGYRYATVKIETHDDHDNVLVNFVFDLGQEIKIGKVIYAGLPAKVFPNQINTVLLNGPGSSYHPELMPFDQGAVVRYVQDQGWLDTTLLATHCEDTDYIPPLDPRRRHGPSFAPDGEHNDSVILVYDLAPGLRYHLGSVSFLGNTVATGAQLREAFSLDDGVPFKRSEIDKAVERARRLISNQGYARCDIDVDRNFDAKDPQRVNLVLHVTEGRKYHIGRVDIDGNFATKDAVVRRGIQLNPGDLWNDDAIDESKRQLERTGLFKRGPDRPLRISPRFPADRADEADLRVNLDEESTGTLNFQVGFSSADGIFIQAGFGERNFNAQGLLLGLITGDVARDWRGAGQNLGVNVQWTRRYTSGDVSWTNPHLFDGPYALTLGYAYVNSRRRSWEEIRSSPSATLGRFFFNNDLRLSLAYTYTDLRVVTVDSDAPNDALDGQGYYHLNTVGLNQSFDRLDNTRTPTRGFLLTANESFTAKPLPTSDEFWTYTLRGDQFIPIVEGEQGGVTYLHFSARWSQIYPLGDTLSAPFYQRFYGGGPAPRHRGFENDRLGPTEINRNGQTAYVGGTTDAVATVEFSIPVQDQNEGIRFNLFADYGNVWGAGEPIKIGDLRTAVGFGIRFPIQIPVALDFAWLLDAKNGESKSQIQFTLGQFRY